MSSAKVRRLKSVLTNYQNISNGDSHIYQLYGELLTVRSAKIFVSNVKNKQTGHHDFLASVFYFCCKEIWGIKPARKTLLRVTTGNFKIFELEFFYKLYKLPLFWLWVSNIDRQDITALCLPPFSTFVAKKYGRSN